MGAIIRLTLVVMMALCSISACAPERTQSQADDKAGGGRRARQMTRQEAEAKHYTPCRICYKKREA